MGDVWEIATIFASAGARALAVATWELLLHTLAVAAREPLHQGFEQGFQIMAATNDLA